MLYILYGPIASGKSTFANSMAQQGALVANDDAIVTAVHGGVYTEYDNQLVGLYKAIRSQIIHSAALTHKSVVVDSTGIKRSTRDHLRTLAQSLNMKTCLVIFRDGVFDPETDGYRRFSADSRGLSVDVWNAVAQKHADTVNPVLPDERDLYDSIKYVTWN